MQNTSTATGRRRYFGLSPKFVISPLFLLNAREIPARVCSHRRTQRGWTIACSKKPRSDGVMNNLVMVIIINYYYHNDDMYVRWMFTSFYIEENREDIIIIIITIIMRPCQLMNVVY